MEIGDPRHLLAQIASILEKADIPYLVSGGMAVFVWGRPRFTADIDIVVELQEKHVDALVKALSALSEKGYIDKEATEDALRRKGEFNFIDGNTGVKVDFWVSRQDEFDRSRFVRKVPKRVLDTDVYFSSPEDLVIMKLLWSLQSESSRQLQDVVSVLEVSGPQLDIPYIQAWAEKLGLVSALQQARKQAARE